MGVLDDVLALAYKPEISTLRSWRTGETLASALPPASTIEETYGSPYLIIHRADLLAALVSACREADGIEIRLGCDVVALDLPTHGSREETALRLADGERIAGDLVLGADGERSFCRAALVGCPDAPKPTGDVVFRVVVSRSDILSDDAHPARDIATPGSVHVWLGPDAHAVSYLLNNNILNLVLIRKQSPSKRARDILYGPQAVDLEDVQRLFQGWDPALRALLTVPGEKSCSKWNLLHLKSLDSWRHESGVHFCVLGDAAHGMPPYLAQGAAQAFEDAAALGALFARLSHPSQIGHVLQVFEQVRRPRAETVKERTLARKVMYGLHDGPEQQKRDERLALGVDSPDELADPDFQKWLWGYDAAADAVRAWESCHC